MDRTALLAELKARARTLGFDAFGIADPSSRPDLKPRLEAALQNGWHAGMDWMEKTKERRADPRALMPSIRSVIMLGMNYAPAEDPLATLSQRSLGSISAYARNRDYHDIVKGRLKELAGLLARRAGADVKVFVDTAPVMEKPLAEAAGLGFQGKHSVLVSREWGGWLFLGAIFTDLALPPDRPAQSHCGSCTRCLDICPTDAFPAPYRLDARRCLAYYSVEHQGPIPAQFRAPMGNRIFGCDDCLAVCPWNKFASAAREIKLQARNDLSAPALADLVALDDARFRALFAGTPVKRLGLARFLRNVLIAIGNSADAALLAPAEARLADPDPVVRGAAVWAVRRLAGREQMLVLARQLRAMETDPAVEAEWALALEPVALGAAA